jgi:hypothetical protein
MIQMPWWLIPLLINVMISGVAAWITAQKEVMASELLGTVFLVCGTLVTAPVWVVFYLFFLFAQ